jgi:hypothetical protein
MLVGSGFLAVVTWRFASLWLTAAAWRNLFGVTHRPSRLQLLMARWIGEAINSLLPVAQIGGDLVRVRLARQFCEGFGKPLSSVEAATTVMIDMTVNLSAQFLMAVIASWQVWRVYHADPVRLATSCVISLLPVLIIVGAQRPSVSG